MADLRVISTGKEFRRVDNATALLLEELFPGNLERLNPAAVRVPACNAVSASIPHYDTPNWAVMHTPEGESYIQLKIARGTYYYTAAANGAVDYFKRMGFVVPENILEQYQRVYKRITNAPIVPYFSSSENKRQAEELALKKQDQCEAILFASDNPGTSASGTFGVEPIVLERFTKDKS